MKNYKLYISERIRNIVDVNNDHKYYCISNKGKETFVEYNKLALVPLGKILKLISDKQLHYAIAEPIVKKTVTKKVKVETKVVNDTSNRLKNLQDELYGY